METPTAGNDASYLKIVHIVDGEEVDITPGPSLPEFSKFSENKYVKEKHHDQN